MKAALLSGTGMKGMRGRVIENKLALDVGGDLLENTTVALSARENRGGYEREWRGMGPQVVATFKAFRNLRNTAAGEPTAFCSGVRRRGSTSPSRRPRRLRCSASCRCPPPGTSARTPLAELSRERFFAVFDMGWKLACGS